MKQFYAGAFLLCTGASLLLLSVGPVQAQCLGAAMGATTVVPNIGWNPPVVPGPTTTTVNGSTTNASITMTLTTTVGLGIGLPVSGPNIPGGTTIASIVNGTTITLSQPATATAGPFPYDFTTSWLNAYPGVSATYSGQPYCNVCPSLFSTNICTNQFVTAYLCIGRVYTISLCNSSPAFNSTLSITNTGMSIGYAYDDDGCGPINGLSTITFVPTISQAYRFRVFNDPCVIAPITCGVIEITCSPAPPPPVNDNPCGAIPLPVNAVCTYTVGGTLWSTQSNPPVAPAAACGALAGADVWYSAVVPASGALAIQTNHVSATNLAMAVYSVGPGGPCTGPYTFQLCNNDIAVGVLNPFISFNLPALAGQTVYIRVWPHGGVATGGTFEICAFEPVPPPNDNPCTATPVPVNAACTTISSTNESATASTGIPVPACVGPYNDVWFTVTVPLAPPGAGVVINTTSGVLNDAALAVYTTSVDCNGVFTTVGCNNPVGPPMPSLTVNQNGGTIVAGTVLYVRVWNTTGVFGPFTICATPTNPPPNDEPCGAIAVPVQYGCLFTPFTNVNASNTPLALGGQHTNVPTTPSCDSPTDSDVWFTVQVPNPVPVPALILDTDDGSMTDAAMGVYRVTSGSCAGGNLVLTQLACAVAGSTNGANMPSITLPTISLVANEILYVRIWRQNNTNGTFQLCARRPDNPPGACSFTLRMTDLAADGWNGSSVQICIDPPGAPPPVCTNYTIVGALGNITFGANIGDLVTLTYTAVAGFQNQISYQLTTPGGGLLFSSGSPPTPGLAFAFGVNAICNIPPAPDEDCAGARQICLGSTTQNNNPGPGIGAVADLTLANRGCLIANERQGVWYTFQVSTSGQLGFTINPFPYAPADYDYGVWGPYASVTCPPVGPPIRCSWADGPVLTGLNWTATDVSETFNGDSWTRYMNVNAGEWYILFIDNFWPQYWGVPFDLTFQFQGVGGVGPPASINCVLPVELLSFSGKPTGTAVELNWSTGSERTSDYFIVERSQDGVQFQPIGRVEAAGNSASLNEYVLVDKAPVRGTNYYRLRQVDTDGASETSHTISVDFHGHTTALHLLPNPATESVQALFDLPMGERFNWRITDASGRLVKEGVSTALDGPDRMEIDLGRIESGAYALGLYSSSNGSLGQARFVKQ